MSCDVDNLDKEIIMAYSNHKRLKDYYIELDNLRNVGKSDITARIEGIKGLKK